MHMIAARSFFLQSYAYASYRLTEGRVAHHTPWVNRQLLFFGGHVPKPTVAGLCYKYMLLRIE